MTIPGQWSLKWLDDGFVRSYPFNTEEGNLISRWLTILNESGVEYAVGGAFAVHAYTGIWRTTKDFDVFIAPGDLKKALESLNDAYFNPDIRDERWLAKVYSTPYTLDLIFGFRNGLLKIDQSWLGHSRPAEIVGIRTRVIAVEELLASKTFIAFRERFDGADMVHLLRETKGRLDWRRLMHWLGEHKDFLLWHLIFFLFVYPGHADYIPKDLLEELFDSIRRQKSDELSSFRGMLLDSYSFWVDCRDFGYKTVHTPSLVNFKGEPL